MTTKCPGAETGASEIGKSTVNAGSLKGPCEVRDASQQGCIFFFHNT